MAWLGLGMVLVGGVLLYSAVKGLHPWNEFKGVLTTGKLPAAKSSKTPAPPH